MATLEQLYAICPMWSFRARHTLDVSPNELDELIRSSNGRLRYDHDTIIKVDIPSPDEADDERCLWTIPLEDHS